MNLNNGVIQILEALYPKYSFNKKTDSIENTIKMFCKQKIDSALKESNKAKFIELIKVLSIKSSSIDEIESIEDLFLFKNKEELFHMINPLFYKERKEEKQISSKDKNTAIYIAFLYGIRNSIYLRNLFIVTPARQIEFNTSIRLTEKNRTLSDSVTFSSLLIKGLYFLNKDEKEFFNIVKSLIRKELKNLDIDDIINQSIYFLKNS